MTRGSTESPDLPAGRHSGAGDETAIAVEASWEKPLVSASGGEATLLVRVVAPPAVSDARRVPLDVAFVLDRSGSMQGGKLDLAKEGVSLAMAHQRDADRVALVVYDHEVTTIQPLASATPRLKTSLRLALHGVDPGGSTNLSGGWLAGCHELAEAPRIPGDGGTSRIRRVILLTDGLANVGMERSARAGRACRPTANARHRHDDAWRWTGLRRGTSQRDGRGGRRQFPIRRQCDSAACVLLQRSCASRSTLP